MTDITDPFEQLREPVVPLAPRPQFAGALRRRLAAALAPRPDPEVQAMPTLEVREYTPARLHALTPYLATNDPAGAIQWYREAFDAQLLDDPIVMEDGRIGHAEMRVGDSVFMLAGEFAEEGHVAPTTVGGSTVGLMLHVPDSDGTYARAVELGATPLRPISEQYGARQGTLRDPFGHRWFIATALTADDVPVEDAPGRRFGDVGYVVFEMPDGERAARFYRDLFGWELHGGYQPGAYHISSITPPSGIDTGYEKADARISFRVDDVDSVVARVRELGGQVLETASSDAGSGAKCVDPQGLRFDLIRPKPGY